MKITITNDEFKYIKKFISKNNKFINKKIAIYMSIYIIVANCALVLALVFNNAPIASNKEELIFPFITTIILGGLILFLEKKVLQKIAIDKRYKYLLNTFNVYIDHENKSLVLSSSKVEIRSVINSKNINIINNLIFLLDNGEIVGIIPLIQIQERDELTQLLNEYMKVV